MYGEGGWREEREEEEGDARLSSLCCLHYSRMRVVMTDGGVVLVCVFVRRPEA